MIMWDLCQESKAGFVFKNDLPHKHNKREKSYHHFIINKKIENFFSVQFPSL